MIWWLIPLLIILFWIYFKFKRSNSHRNIIGNKIAVDYFDQNSTFETIFPLIGTITEKIKVGNQEFFLVQFDNTFVYNNRDFDKIIIKERHAGYYIGGKGEIHVHVCLPKKEIHWGHIELTDFDHVVWATIKNV